MKHFILFALAIIICTNLRAEKKTENLFLKFNEIPIVNNLDSLTLSIENSSDTTSPEYLNALVTLTHNQELNTLFAYGDRLTEIKALNNKFKSVFVTAFIDYSILFNEVLREDKNATLAITHAKKVRQGFSSLDDSLGVFQALALEIKLELEEIRNVERFVTMVKDKNNASHWQRNTGKTEKIIPLKKIKAKNCLAQMRRLIGQSQAMRIHYYILASHVAYDLTFFNDKNNYLDSLNLCGNIANSNPELYHFRPEIYKKIGNYYFAKTKIDDCIKHHKLALQHTKYKASFNYTTALFNIGNDYYFSNNLDSSMSYLLQAYSVCKQYTQMNTRTISFMLNDIQLIYAEQRNYKKAYDFLYSYKNANSATQEKALFQSFRTTEVVKELSAIKETNKIKFIIQLSTIGALISFLIIIIILYKNYNRKKIDAEKLRNLQSSKDQIFTMIAHDIVSPMRAHNKLTLLLAGLIRDNNHEQILPVAEHLENDTNILNHNIENFFNLAKHNNNLIPKQPSIENITELIEKSINLHKLSLQNNKIEIVKEYDDDHMWSINAFYFSNIFRNALDNAIKHSPEKSCITIRTYSTNSNYEITVCNNGSIPAKKMKRIHRVLFNNDTALLQNNTISYGLQIIKIFADKINATANYTSNDNIVEFKMSILKA